MGWYGMGWDGMVWYGMVWYGMVWYGMVWYALSVALGCVMSFYTPALITHAHTHKVN